MPALSVFVVMGLAGLFILAGLAFFLRPRWFTAWLKGMVAFCLLAVGGALAVLALNLRYYHALDHLTPVATVTAAKLGPQRWQVIVATPNSKARNFVLKGDQWQIDARILQFDSVLRWIGLGPLYQLDRLSGRYLTLEQERSSPRSVYGLAQRSNLDLWKLEREVGLPFVKAKYGNSVFMPLKDGARYTLSLSLSGLVANPDNQIARKAVADWF